MIIGRPLNLLRLLGVLLACFAVDYRVLFETLTEEIVQDGFQYYRTFFNAPLGIKVRNAVMSPGGVLRLLVPKKTPADFFKNKLGHVCVRAYVALTGAASWTHGRGSHRDHQQNTPLGRECDVLRWRIVR